MQAAAVAVSRAAELLERVVQAVVVQVLLLQEQQTLVAAVVVGAVRAVQALLLLDTQSGNLKCVRNAKSLNAKILLI
jgi:hypothetical protein